MLNPNHIELSEKNAVPVQDENGVMELKYVGEEVAKAFYERYKKD